MKRGKRILLIVLCVLLCLFVLREIGIVDVNLYKSRLSNKYSHTKNHVNLGQEKHFSYHVTLKQGSEIIGNYQHSYDNLPQVEIEAVLDEPIYSGNYALPFVKNFKMTYLCNFTTMKSAGGHEIKGQIKGEVEGEIRGFCSRRKAKELAFEKAKKQMTDFCQKLSA